ncbi:MAG: 1-acyl-sn-glycerol-3-phosphate acyltransferase [Spirochaetales bacterium]|nr:1-acyl-sn-glycerol-3-phosphate acyltransferase [Spirochaetales bacterium]
MGTLIFILSFIVCVVAWDLFARLRYVFVRRRYADFWNDFFRMMTRFSVLLARVYAGLRFVRESAVPYESLPDRFLLVTNHQSLADIAILVCAFPGHDLKYAAKKELKYGIPSISLGLRLGNHAFVNRRGGFGETMRSLDKLLRHPGRRVCPVVFPEGTRSRTGHLGRFHSAGIRYILDHSDLPVVSAAVEGGYRIQKFIDFFTKLRGLVYRTKILKVHPHVGGKSGVQTLLDEIAREIEAQLGEWRA